MSHRRAVLLMVLVTLLWSMAGVVSRHLEGARSFEVTFWRSAFSSLAFAPMNALSPSAAWRPLSALSEFSTDSNGPWMRTPSSLVAARFQSRNR